MLDADKLLQRIQSFGASLELKDGKIRIVNGGRLPAEAKSFIAEHKAAIADHLREVVEPEFEERAAIIEFDAGGPREWAEQFAQLLISRRPPNVDDLTWTEFIIGAGRIIDELPSMAAREAA